VRGWITAKIDNRAFLKAEVGPPVERNRAVDLAILERENVRHAEPA